MIQPKRNKIAFLFGSGVSIPAKMPKTNEISDLIFEGKNIIRDSAMNFFIGNPSGFNWSIYKDVPKRVQSFIKILKSELTEYYKDSTRPINYEDVYYLLDFFRLNYYDNEGNPSFKYLLKEFEPRIKELLFPIDPLLDHNFELNELIEETRNYIKDLVTILLSQKAQSFDGFKLLKESIDNAKSFPIEIFTLNHDAIIEQFLQSETIIFNDGFEKKDNDYSFWNPCLFDVDNKINLYKIHGSVNWHYFDEESWKDRRICKVSPNAFWRNPKKSILLIGTYNKLSEYNRNPFLELFYRFNSQLNKCTHLIVSGYSFSDKGVNEKIFDWLLTNSNRKIIIIDPFVNILREKMPTILWGSWNTETIIPINDYIENIAWANIKDKL